MMSLRSGAALVRLVIEAAMAAIAEATVATAAGEAAAPGAPLVGCAGRRGGLLAPAQCSGASTGWSPV
jgi:hypothetical protein